MKVNKVEIKMDMNKMIQNIIENEEDVVAVNCAKGVAEAGISFEKIQKDAGLIKNMTWDMTWKNDVPSIKRKGGNLASNFNYVVFTVEMVSEDAVKAYTAENGKKLIQALSKHKLDTYQCLAYAKGNILYLMFNAVDGKGKKFTAKEDGRVEKAFAG